MNTERSNEVEYTREIEDPRALELPHSSQRSREFGVQTNLIENNREDEIVQIEYKAPPTPPVKAAPKPKENERKKIPKQSEKSQKPSHQRPPLRNNQRNKPRDNATKKEIVSKKPSPTPVKNSKPKSPPFQPVQDRKKTPPVLDQKSDFVPFIRSVNVLDPAIAEEPLPVSREQSSVVRGRKAYTEGQQPAKYGTEMLNRDDPIFNPGLVKDNPTMRQSRILQHLSDLRRVSKILSLSLPNLF